MFSWTWMLQEMSVALIKAPIPTSSGDFSARNLRTTRKTRTIDEQFQNFFFSSDWILFHHARAEVIVTPWTQRSSENGLIIMPVIMSGISFLIVLYLIDTFPYPAWSGIRVSAVLVGPSDSTLIFIRPFWHAIFLTNFILSIINIHLSMPQRFYEFYASSCKVN